MAGEIEEPFRLNFQADSPHSGSISFGRFECEALCWERRSSFSHNRYLEEVEKCSKPGLVFEKKAYFEAHFRKKGILGILGQSSPGSKEYQTSENDVSENLNGDHSACFDEIENEVTQFEKEVFGRSISEPQIEVKYDSYGDGSVPETIKVEESQDTTHEDLFLPSSTPEMEIKENLDCAENSGTSSKEKVPLEAEVTKSKLKPRLGVAKSRRYISDEEFKVSKNKPGEKVNDGIQRPKTDVKISGATVHNKHQVQKIIKHEPGSKTKEMNRIRSVGKESKESGQRAIVYPQSSTTLQKISTRTRQSAIRSKPATGETKPGKKQDSSRSDFKCTDEKLRIKETKVHQLHAKTQEKNGEIKLLSKSLNFKATPMPSFYNRALRESDRNKATVSSVKQQKPQASSLGTGTKVSENVVLRSKEGTRKTIDPPQQASGAMSCQSTVTSDSNPSSPAAAQITNNSLSFGEINSLVGLKKEHDGKRTSLGKHEVVEDNDANKVKTMEGKQKTRTRYVAFK